MSGGVSDTYAAADELDLLPTPRELELADAHHDLRGWELVVPSDADGAEIGAAELNDRIAELDGRPLPVRQRSTGAPAVLLGRWNDRGIRDAAMALDVTVTADDPGEQGYVIAFGEHEDRPIALLAGSDAQGMLYAAVTFRRLIDTAQSGVVHAREASVRDWPDYAIRNNGRLRLGRLADVPASLGDLTALDQVTAELKRQVDGFLRHKVNYVHATAFEPDADTDARLFGHRAERAAAVLAYAHERAITTRFPGGVEIGEYLRADERAAAVERDEGTSYLWAALAAHRRRAADFADSLPDGAGVYSLHPYDGGGYLHPENWDKRSAATREMYGDDRAAADLEQFMLYFTTVRDAHPDIELEAVVYPYHYQFAREEFPETYEELAADMPSKGGWFGAIEDAEHANEVSERLLEYSRRIDEALPDDVYVVFREGGTEEFEAAIELYGDRPLTLWVYPARNKGWLGTFTPQVRWPPATYWRPERRDYFYLPFAMTRTGDRRVTRLAQQEYLWQVDRPDAEPAFENRLRRYEHGGREVTHFQRDHLIPRIARILYGEAAPAFAELMADNVSLNYVADPESVAGVAHETEYFETTDAYMDEQAAAFDRHADTFAGRVDELEARDRLAALCLDRRRDRTVARRAAWSIFYYRYATVAAAKANLRAAASDAERLLTDGQTVEARDRAAQALDGLPSIRERIAAVRDRSLALFEQLPPLHVDAPPFDADGGAELDGGPSYGDRLAPLETFDGTEVEARLNAVVSQADREEGHG